jgi:hypothetical protein
MADLELRQGQAGLGGSEPRITLLLPVSVRRPSIPLSEQADKERTRAINLGETQTQHLAFLGFFLGDPPSQIDIYDVDLNRCAAVT